MIMELELIYNEETQEWQQRSEPFSTIEVETEEDFEFIGNAIAFYKKHIEPKTNADRIRAMSDEELAVLVRSVIVAEDCPVTGGDCDKCFFNELCFNGEKWYGKETEWLKQPAEE